MDRNVFANYFLTQNLTTILRTSWSGRKYKGLKVKNFEFFFLKKPIFC